MKKSFDVVCIGELLMDFIGKELDVPVGKTKEFAVHPGGSPANLAKNLSNLNLNTTLVATVGKDSFGDFLIDNLKGMNINTEYIRRCQNHSTSIILISKSSQTADFIPYRGADNYITIDQLPSDVFTRTRIVHTTFFALSISPAQDSILTIMKRAALAGAQISVDANFSERIWPERENALKTLKEICALHPLIKVSDDDLKRLFGNGISDLEVLQQLRDWGAKFIALTKGRDGTLFLEDNQLKRIPACTISRLEDATGAGDTYWSGVLFNYLKGKSFEDGIHFGSRLAAKKLEKVGLLTKSEIQSVLYP